MPNQDELITETEKFSKDVTQDAKFTILTIRNLIKSNSMVERAVDELHKSIVNSNVQNEKLQKRIYWLTIVGIGLAIIQVFGVILNLQK